MLLGLAIVLVSAVGLFVCTRASRASAARSLQTQGAIWLLLAFGILLPIGLLLVGVETVRYTARLAIENDVLRTNRHDVDRAP
jgi:multisubunit Na+/H+ antiporter MnhG subunit